MKMVIVLSLLISGCGIVSHTEWDGFCENVNINSDVMWKMVSAYEYGSDFRCNETVPLWDPLSNCSDGLPLVPCKRPVLKGKRCITGTDCIIKDFSLGSRHAEVLCYTDVGICNQLYLYNSIPF